MNGFLELDNLNWQASEYFRIFKVDLTLDAGKCVVISGYPESGRSLLLKLIAGIYLPDSGKITFKDKDIHGGNEDEIKKARSKIAYVFEAGVHLSNIIIRENLLLPLKFYYNDFNRKETEELIQYYIDYFNLGNLLDKRPAEVSIIKRKILNLIRALIQKPELLLLDEPLFNLDIRNQKLVISLLKKLKKNGMSLMIVCNSIDILKAVGDILVIMDNGSVISILSREDPDFLKEADKLEFIDLAGVEDEI